LPKYVVLLRRGKNSGEKEMLRRSMVKSRKAQYLALDAFIAMMMLAVGLLLIFSTRTTVTYSKQPVTLSQDIADTLTSLKLNELNNQLIRNMTLNHTITNTENTVLQQAAEFYIHNHLSQASDLIKNVSHDIIPDQFSYDVTINNVLIYSNEGNSDKNTSRLLISTRKILFGTVNRTAEAWGPLVGEIAIWE
jgi:ribosomal protein L30/L7E